MSSSADDARAAAVAKFARDINCLSDADRAKRRGALNALKAALFSGTQAELARDLLLHELQAPLVNCLSDAAEMNRELACGMLSSALAGDASGALHAGLFSPVLAVLVRRVGRTPFPEDAEEVRLQLAQLGNRLWGAPACAAQVEARYADVVDVVRALSGDAFPACKQEAALAVRHLCVAAPRRVHLALGPLVTSQLGNLGHQRGPVRVSALEALHHAVPLGAESLPEALADSILPALRTLRFDRTPPVRRALAATCAHWLTALPPHARSAADAPLLAILAVLVGDETADVADYARDALQRAAELRETAGGAAAGAPAPGSGGADLAVAAAAAATTEGGAPAAAAAVRHGGGSGVGDASTGDGEGPWAGSPAELPQPYALRPPSAAVTVLVQRHLSGVLGIVLPELADWTARGRVAGALALRSVLVLAHGAVASALEAVLTALCTGSRDEDPEVRRLLREAGRLLGSCVAPEAQLGVLLPQLRGEVSGLNNAQHYTAALEVLSSAIRSMPAPALQPLLGAVASALGGEQLAEEGAPLLRAALARAVAATIDAAIVARSGDAERRRLEHEQQHGRGGGGTGARRVQRSFSVGAEDGLFGAAAGSGSPVAAAWLDDATLDALLLALLVCGEHGTAEDVAASAVEAAHRMAVALGYGHSALLFAAAAHRLVPRICAGAGAWGVHSPSRRLFDALLRLGRPALSGRSAAEAAALVGAVVNAFAASLAPDADPALRIAQLALCDSFILGPDEGAAGGGGAARRHRRHASESGGAAASAALPLEPGDVPDAVSGHMDVVPTFVASASAAADVQRVALASGGGHMVSDVEVDEALRGSSGGGALLLARALLPNAVWRVGLVPATIRKVAVACAASLVQRDLVPPAALLTVLFSETGGLATLKAVLADDDAATRHMATQLLRDALRAVRGCVDPDVCRGLYHETLKRLDDSNDAVRVAGCAALVELAAAPPAPAAECWRGTPVEYVVDTLLLHLDDPSPPLQEAVYGALAPWAALAPAYAARVAGAAAGRHRTPELCQRLLRALEGSLA